MKFIVWQPGNGTRYECYIGEVKDEQDDPLILFCWVNRGSGGRAMVMQKEGYLSYDYFREKMKVNNADAAALLVLIARETKRVCSLPPGFDHNGCHSTEHPRGLVLEPS